jgi:hypothetical protein
MKTRIIHTKFWKDDFVSSLTPEEKLIFNFYITNEGVNILHLYELPDREIIFYTGVSEATLKTAKEKLQKAGKLFFNDNFVFLKNADRYENFSGEKNDKAKVVILKEVPIKIKDWYNKIKNTPIDTPPIGSINQKSEIITHKSEIRNQKDTPIESFKQHIREKLFGFKG